MRFSVLKEALRLCRDCRITSSIWGHRGIGKSEVVKQVANEGDGEIIEFENKKIALPIGFIDYRLSQLEASDIRGLPDKCNGRTVFLPPSELPVGDRDAADIFRELQDIKDLEERRIRAILLQPHYRRGILFLDEMNRAQDDVLQAVFQLIYDLRIGQYVLPSEWSIIVAGNYLEGDYITGGFNDAAMLDRMCHLHLVAGEQTLDEWCSYMVSKHGEASSSIIEFCASNVDNLVGQTEGTLGFSIQPSPRSWDRVAKVDRIVSEKGYSEDARFAVVSGIVGLEAASAYTRYSCPVKPRDILKDGIAKHRDKLVSLNRNELIGVAWGLISLARDKIKDDRVTDICLDFAEVLLSSDKVADKDIVVAFCRSMVGEERAEYVAALTNRKLAEAMFSFNANINNFLKRLYGRKHLHSMISSTGFHSSKG